MEILLTDCENTFLSSSTPFKILFSGFTIKEDTFLEKSFKENILTSLGGCEFEALEKTLKELYAKLERDDFDFPTNKILTKRNAFLRKIAILLPLYKITYFRNISLLILIQSFHKHNVFQAFKKITIILSSDFALPRKKDFRISQTDKIWTIKHVDNASKKTLYPVVKSFLSFFKHSFVYFKNNFFEKRIQNSKFKILLILYNIPHHQQVLSTFFDLVKQRSDITLDIVLYDLNFVPENQKTYLENRKTDNIRVFRFKDFAAPSFPPILLSFRVWKRYFNKYSFKNIYINITNTLTAYSWMKNTFRMTRPNICVQMSIHETGRYMADVANYFSIPSIQLDYALFSDNSNMESNICYSKRLPISEAISEIWKKRKDPTPIHKPIGYCKFDKIEYSNLSTDTFLKQIGLNPKQKTIFFASTWADKGSAYLEEKRTILENLSKFCKQQEWNLLIKKHPLEFDNIAEDAINFSAEFGQKVFSHQDLSIFNAIKYSDLIVNQMSSIVLECLYFDKPFCYISRNSENMMSDLSVFKNEKFAFQFSEFEKFEKFAQEIIENKTYRTSIIKEIQNRKSYFLHKTDGRASERLLDELLTTHLTKQNSYD